MVRIHTAVVKRKSGKVEVICWVAKENTYKAITCDACHLENTKGCPARNLKPSSIGSSENDS